MTTYATATKKCAHCGAETACDVLNSTNQFGSADLDLRPPEMARSTMGTWLQQCPHCHFVNTDLSEPIPDIGHLLQSAAIQRIMTDAATPPLAKKFACFAELQRGRDAYESGEAALRAAWVCDDAELTELAREFRNQAIEALLPLPPSLGGEGQIVLRVRLVDILRRANRFVEAAQLATELSAEPGVRSNEILAAVIAFQNRLCSARDDTGYTIAAAMGEDG
jgi:hypothetical protein